MEQVLAQKFTTSGLRSRVASRPVVPLARSRGARSKDGAGLPMVAPAVARAVTSGPPTLIRSDEGSRSSATWARVWA